MAKNKFVYSYRAEYYVWAEDAQKADELFAHTLEHGTYTDDINKQYEGIKRLSWPEKDKPEEHVWNFETNKWEQTKHHL